MYGNILFSYSQQSLCDHSKYNTVYILFLYNSVYETVKY
jgi:hypothetical protein